MFASSIQRFPDNPEMERYLVRDLIAPRFFRLMAMETRKAIMRGRKASDEPLLPTFDSITGHMGPKYRIPLQCFSACPFFRFRQLLTHQFVSRASCFCFPPHSRIAQQRQIAHLKRSAKDQLAQQAFRSTALSIRPNLDDRCWVATPCRNLVDPGRSHAEIDPPGIVMKLGNAHRQQP